MSTGKEKQRKNYFILSNHKASDVFELIHCDLWEHIELRLLVVLHIFLTIVDVVRISLLIDKKEVTRTIINFFVMVERQFNRKFKVVPSDFFVFKDVEFVEIMFPFVQEVFDKVIMLCNILLMLTLTIRVRTMNFLKRFLRKKTRRELN